MKMKQSTNAVLLLLFIVSLIIYIVIFASAFTDLPMNIPPWHQLLLLTFHFFPMLFLELLLCQNAKLKWRLLIPMLSLLAVGVWFLSFAGWELLGWLLFLFWCIAPLLGSLVACGIWAIAKRLRYCS